VSQAPLLLIAGGKDDISPVSVVKTNFNLYRKSTAVTGKIAERSWHFARPEGWSRRPRRSRAHSEKSHLRYQRQSSCFKWNGDGYINSWRS